MKAAGFGTFLRHPGVPAVLLPSLLSRLPSGMINIALVLAIARSSSYTDAGVVIAIYSVASGLASPLRGRAAARRGAARIVAGSSLAQGGFMIGLAAATWQHWPLLVLAVLGFGSGATLPPLNPVMRALWSSILRDDPAARTAASSFESMVVDLVYILGPGAVSLIILASSASTALLACGLLRVLSGFWLTWMPLLRHELLGKKPSGRVSNLLGPLRLPAVQAMMPVGLLAFGSIPAVEVAVTAFAQHHGHSAAAGPLIGVLSVGGVLGGIGWGVWSPKPGSTSVQLAVLLTLLAVGWTALALSDSVVVLGLILLGCGVVMNPVITAQYDTLNEVTPPDEATEAFGWLNAMNAAGGAIGAVGGGALSETGGRGGFALAGLMVAGAAVAAVWVAMHLRSR